MKNYLVYALFGISDGGALERCLNLLNQPEEPSRDEVLRKVSETYGIIPLDVSIKEN
jgi:hypothetical protein